MVSERPLRVTGCVLLLELCFLSLCSIASAQYSGEGSPSPSQRHVPVFGNANEFAIASDFEYYDPLPGFDRQNRDMDVELSSLAVVAHMRHGWEFQFDGLAIRGHGYRTRAGADASAETASNAAGLGIGPLARWNFVQFRRLRIFIDAGGDFLMFDRPWPVGGTVNDFLLRAGGGVSARVSGAYWIESTFHFAHVSDGECFCATNPTWQGSGLSLGLRRTFAHDTESQANSGSFFGRADQGAWITSGEDYTPAPWLQRQIGKTQADMRELRVSRAWHFADGLELQLGGMFQTTQTTAGVGPVLRWNFLERERWRVFVDGGVDLLANGSPAFIVPWPGMGFNFFPRARAGASWRLHGPYWLEAGYGYGHVTAGFGGNAKLLPWSGEGASLGMRYTFGERPRLNIN